MIGAQYPILAGSTIEIDLPEDLSFYLIQDTEANSKTSGVADLSANFRVTNNGRTVTVFDAFTQISAPNGVDYR
jgi:N-acetyl-gamma-glutamylphosphate reductase